jgi:hypothetical protein
MIVNPTPAALPAGITVLLTGHARPNPTSSVALAAVTINDRPVDALDQAGQFFARVTIAPGRNNFTFIARSASGETASALVTIFGTDPAETGLDLSVLFDVTSSLTPDWGRTSFNEQASTLFADLAIRNTGQYPVKTPLVIGITRLSDPSVRVLNPDGLTPRRHPLLRLLPTDH